MARGSLPLWERSPEKTLSIRIRSKIIIQSQHKQADWVPLATTEGDKWFFFSLFLLFWFLGTPLWTAVGQRSERGLEERCCKSQAPIQIPKEGAHLRSRLLVTVSRWQHDLGVFCYPSTNSLHQVTFCWLWNQFILIPRHLEWALHSGERLEEKKKLTPTLLPFVDKNTRTARLAFRQQGKWMWNKVYFNKFFSRGRNKTGHRGISFFFSEKICPFSLADTSPHWGTSFKRQILSPLAINRLEKRFSKWAVDVGFIFPGSLSLTHY